MLRHDAAITVAALGVLWVLTWAYLAQGAGLAMHASMPPMPGMPGMQDMPGMATMPGMAMDAAAGAWTPTTWALVVAMWWTMMVAMMLPGAAPTVLLYARVHRHAQGQGRVAGGNPPTAAFVVGYFVAWALFSIVATAAQQGLEHAGRLSPMTLAVQGRWLPGATLVAVGLYQWSPWKDACLSHCRAPAAFLARHWRPGASGALRLGVWHGAFCIGCCWLLMALLFVVGVMELAWIAALSLLVLAEKHVPGGRWVGRGAGVVLVAWGLVVLTR